MRGGELLHIKAIRKNTIWFSLQQVLAFECCDMGDGGENIGGMSCCSLDAISMIYATFSGFSINIKPLEVVIKVHRACAEIPSKKSGVCGEDGCYVYMPFLRKRQSNACKPLMEVCNDSPLLFPEGVLETVRA